MTPEVLSTVLKTLRKAAKNWKKPVLQSIGEKREPFRVLICSLLSLRTRDEVTEEASRRLFALARTPRGMLRVPPTKVQNAIYPVAFFRNKRRDLLALCRTLIRQHDGKVPDTLEGLLSLPGVGRKTANLTLILAFDKPGICVDVHVHRICNRWGLVSTRTPDETEQELRQSLPRRYWKELNFLLVALGQNCCKPVSPQCSECCVEAWCPRIGVTRSR